MIRQEHAMHCSIVEVKTGDKKKSEKLKIIQFDGLTYFLNFSMLSET